jgi:hypothetical protein
MSEPLFELPIARPVPRTEEGPKPLPTVLEFAPLGETGRWRVEQFEAFRARFPVTEDRDTAAREVAAIVERVRVHSQIWLVVRRIYGIGPVIPPANADMDDLRSWGKEELAEKLKLAPVEVDARLEAARALTVVRESQKARKPESEVLAHGHQGKGEGEKGGAEGELVFDEDEVLAQFGFSPTIFELTWQMGTEQMRRPASEERAEKTWFAARVKDNAPMLREARAATTVRQMLMNELYARRLEVDMAKLRPSTKEWRDLQTAKDKLEEAIGRSRETLTEMFPDMNVGDKVTYRRTVSDLVRGYQEYYARGENKLIDAIHTADEIDFITRQSVQIPEARIRLGQQVAIVEAIKGIWDPKWRPQLKPGVLKRIDAAGRAAVESVRQAEGTPLMDLEGEEPLPPYGGEE